VTGGPLSASAAGALLLTFYGDDFTGSTDVMESLELAGVRTVLFLDAPTPQQLSRYQDVGAVGVAGISRTMSPEQMDATLPAILERIALLGAPIFHYKVCSTFDSSPEVGSIGRAAEIVRRVFGAQPIPLVVGAPELGRYTAFGHLFATANGGVHRLDRHPTMRVHPVTPMSESEVLRHLAAQTELPGALVDFRSTGATDAVADAAVDTVMSSGAALVLLDVLDEVTQRQVGRILLRLADQRAEDGRGPLAIIGSSGVEYSLGRHWAGEIDAIEGPLPADQTLVIAGSRAPATDAQIDAALAAGFADVLVDPAAVTGEATAEAAIADACSRAGEAWRGGGHVLVRTPPKTGADDVDGTALAAALGRIAAGTCAAVDVRRLMVAGGDTSGLVARALGIEALRLLQPLAPGAPLCRASSSDPRFDGMEICLKAGQIGAPDYFVRVAELGSAPRHHSPRKETTP
jgi:uncharacterized protein YgbK (DUF1537 family)